LGLDFGGAAAPRAGTPARVLRLETSSDQRLAHVALDGTDQEIVAALPPTAAPAPGDAVLLLLGRPLWFDAHGQRIRA
jgi:hypothetical protein